MVDGELNISDEIPTPKRLSYSVNNTFPKLRMSKGRQGNLDVVLWSPIPPCEPDECPIGIDCPYKGTRVLNCSMQQKYLMFVFESILITHSDKMDDEKMQQVGFHLIPLYGHLVKCKIEEHALRRVTYLTAKGEIKMHPIYREIRQIISQIQSVYKEIFPNAPVGRVGGNLPKAIDMESAYGDPDYYDAVSSGKTGGPEKESEGGD